MCLTWEVKQDLMIPMPIVNYDVDTYDSYHQKWLQKLHHATLHVYVYGDAFF